MMIKLVAFLGAIGSVAAVSLNTDAGMQMDSFAEAYPEYNFAELDVEAPENSVKNQKFIEKIDKEIKV